MIRVYCDTCVYIDAMNLGKNDDPLRPLMDFAWHFFNEVQSGKYILVTSSWVFDEFKNVIGSDRKLVEFVDELQLTKKVHIDESENDIKEAKKLSSNNLDDARHVILAKKANAIIITTRNQRHFAEFEDYLKKHSIELKLPESL